MMRKGVLKFRMRAPSEGFDLRALKVTLATNKHAQPVTATGFSKMRKMYNVDQPRSEATADDVGTCRRLPSKEHREVVWYESAPFNVDVPSDIETEKCSSLGGWIQVLTSGAKGLGLRDVHMVSLVSEDLRLENKERFGLAVEFSTGPANGDARASSVAPAPAVSLLPGKRVPCRVEHCLLSTKLKKPTGYAEACLSELLGEGSPFAAGLGQVVKVSRSKVPDFNGRLAPVGEVLEFPSGSSGRQAQRVKVLKHSDGCRNVWYGETEKEGRPVVFKVAFDLERAVFDMHASMRLAKAAKEPGDFLLTRGCLLYSPKELPHVTDAFTALMHEKETRRSGATAESGCACVLLQDSAEFLMAPFALSEHWAALFSKEARRGFLIEFLLQKFRQCEAYASCGLYDPDRLNNCLLGTASSRGSAGFADFDFDKSMTGDLAIWNGARNKLLNTDYDGELHGPATLQVGRYRSILLQALIAPVVFLLGNDFGEGRLAPHIARSASGPPSWEFASASLKATLEDPGIVPPRVRKALVDCLNFDGGRNAALALLTTCQADLRRESKSSNAKGSSPMKRKKAAAESPGAVSSPLGHLAKALRTGPRRVEQISVLSSSLLTSKPMKKQPGKVNRECGGILLGQSECRKRRAAAARSRGHARSTRVRVTLFTKKKSGIAMRRKRRLG